MPSIIFRYLAREMLQVMLAVTGVVLLIIMSGRFVNYLAQAASGALNADFLFAIMGYRMPEFLVMIIPLGLFLGIIMAYGRLYVENEMTILGATGMSQGQLLRMTMIPSLGVMALVAFLSLYIAPKGIQQVEMLLIQQDAMTEFDTLVPGRFQLLEGGSRVTYTEALSGDRQQMQKVFIASRSDDPNSAVMSLVLADSGRISTTEEQGQRYLILNDGFRYDMIPGVGNVRVIEYDTYGLRMEERTINEEISREQALPTSVLIKSNDTRLIAELQWRLSLPLLVPIIVLLAVPLSRVNPRQGRFVKLLPGVLLYLFYLALLMFARSAVDDQRIPASIGVWWVHAIYLAIGLLLVSQETLQLKLGRSKANA
ncbi:permease [Endozoicomonas montiporae]|uniref:Lipopolysaccharide export system permease protein LptF n=2 Tax=Endozoicomonas montiporae TaxID=1027273 RepID=A0A081N765_9GAMM|nr:LPS export ABC transporter permease LptF [Endozoicomonas montiporae]AMO55892.1 lipopolysaccharide export system permease protein [Endozoicomonas montiporae CL-33]KEQ14288.1 permease [Endozoicomonas montiporae]